MRNKPKAQMMVEFVFSVGLLMPLVWALSMYGDWMLTKKRAQCLARTATWLQATALLPSETIAAEINERIRSVQQKKPRQQWQARWGRFLETPAAGFYDLVFTEVEVSFLNERLIQWGLPLTLKEKLVIQKSTEEPL